jgi:hypothetical protein
MTCNLLIVVVHVFKSGFSLFTSHVPCFSTVCLFGVYRSYPFILLVFLLCVRARAVSEEYTYIKYDIRMNV